jgi:hypothetical protein
MTLERPEAIARNVGGFKQVMYVNKRTGAEVVEVCKPDTGELVARKERRRTAYGADCPWEWTYGQPVRERRDVDVVELSDRNPIFFRQDTPREWSWRIRQIPYPANVYKVTVDADKNQIVVRTTNKKYFKRIDAPAGEVFQQSEVNWNWGYETLVITHKKPPRVVAQDQAENAWRRSLPSKEEGEADCPTQ